MEPQRDDWSNWIMVGGAVLGGATGFLLVMLLTNILGRFWGLCSALALLVVVGFLGYKVLIE